MMQSMWMKMGWSMSQMSTWYQHQQKKMTAKVMLSRQMLVQQHPC